MHEDCDLLSGWTADQLLPYINTSASKGRGEKCDDREGQPHGDTARLPTSRLPTASYEEFVN